MEAQRVSNAGAQILSTGNGAYTARARLAAEAAAQHAAAVDADRALPGEAFAEIRKQRLLGIMVPRALGGEGATIAEVADVCFMLGQACASTGADLRDAPDQDGLHRAPLQGQRRARAHAAADRSASSCCSPPRPPKARPAATCARARRAIEHDGEQVTLERKATVISYARGRGRHRDDGAPRRGCRGVGSGAARVPQEGLHARAAAGLGHARHARHVQRGLHAHARDAPAHRSCRSPTRGFTPQTMVPFAHLLWGSVWAGIAAAATAQAQAFVRNALRSSGGQMPPGAAHFTKAASHAAHAARRA